MVISRTTRENIPYVLKSERGLPPEQQTTFLLATISNDLMLSLMEMGQKDQTKASIELALRAGLRGWKNFPDQNGHETPFERDSGNAIVHGVQVRNPVSKATLELVPTSILMELGTAIVQVNQLDADEAKN